MRAISAVVGLVVLLAAGTSAQDAGREHPSLLKATFSKLPIYFIENRGVYSDEVKFYVQGADKTLFFTKEGITFRLKGKARGWVVKLEFVGANPDVRPRGEERQQAVFSYFKGPPKDWKTGLGTYAKVVYEDLWPGIDLVYRGTVNRLKYEFVVKPGGDPGKIRLRYRGATEVEVTDAGGLRVETPVGSFKDETPLACQEIDGERVPVETAFQLPVRSGEDGHEFGFRVGDYDRTLPVVLDPAVLVYCGYIGGVGSDGAFDVDVDANGNVYVGGTTSSSETSFPAVVGPYLKFKGTQSKSDAFVAKVDVYGSGLIYCGYIGGSSDDGIEGIAVDAWGRAHVVGWTDSSEATFPVKLGPDLTLNGTQANAFVARVDSSGKALDYCGYIGDATGAVAGMGIATDATGNAYVTGDVYGPTSTFPVKVGPRLSYNGGGPFGGDAFVAKVNGVTAALEYCGYIGGSGEDHGYAIAVDRLGYAYVTGVTDSTEATFPVKAGPDLTYNGGGTWPPVFPPRGDAFVAKVDTTGSSLAYCGYIGGANDEEGTGVAVDGAGRAYVAGNTTSSAPTFPAQVGPSLLYSGPANSMSVRNGDAFVARVSASGTSLDYCGYVGGMNPDNAADVGVDSSGNAVLAGQTWSDQSTFPVTIGPDVSHNGGIDAFVAMVNNAGTGFVYCGYVGGSGNDIALGAAVGRFGDAYAAGATLSSQVTSFPVKVGPDLTYNGAGDCFVAKIAFSALHGSGVPRPGASIALLVVAPGDASLAYQVATSLGTGPIPIDTRKLDLSPDALLMVTVMGFWPTIFSGYRGVIGLNGQAQAAIHIPNVPALIGVRLHSAFVTLDPAAPSGIRSISNTFSFSITK